MTPAPAILPFNYNGDSEIVPETEKQSATAKFIAIPKMPGLAKDSPGATGTAPTPLSSAAPTSSNSNGEAPKEVPKDMLSTSRDINGDRLSFSSPNPERSGYNFDVYAKSYIPSRLRAINKDTPGSIINTETKHRIAFNVYSSKFAGRDFLGRNTLSTYQSVNDEAIPVGKLTEQSYMQHFSQLHKLECIAKERENEHYALYGVSLEAITMPNDECLWALSVPGLREDSPLVEMGDTLQIRQLWVDYSGNSIQVPIPMQSAGEYPTIVYKTWTEKQYNGSVYAVSRVKETVYLKMDGLNHLFISYGQPVIPMIVNVVFPLKQAFLQSQNTALSLIGQRLQEFDKEGRDSTAEIDSSSESPPRTSSLNPAQNDWIRRMLFPTEAYGMLQTQPRRVPHRALFDHLINYEQAHAVNSVCAADYGTLPYLISGPPGTGKTKTMVEVAMQLLNTTEITHILVCAPSEAAADTLAMRLAQYLTPKQLLRLNRPGRADNEVPRELLPYCYLESDMFYLPPFKTLLSFSVVVTSCRDAAILAEARLTNVDLWTLERDIVSSIHPEDEVPIPSLHWGALLLDEAAQATEIDALPAISVVCPPSAIPKDHAQPRLVMAGDENQLGPRTASQDPGYSTSLFARLFSRSMFTNHPLSRSNIKPSSGPPVLKRSMLPILYSPFSNLTRNYRSHPAILSVPSSHFYHDTLIPEASLPSTPLQNSTLWRGRKWPVLYIPHTGHDEIERDNGGWYNVSEAKLACLIAQTLVLESEVRQEDICIMSPFAAQVKLLRSTIREREYAGGLGLWSVNIGPVEAFQGLEKRVVIICMTRTRSRFVADDMKKGMGLIGQKRKMNVALTRAREGLFVIGSPEVMGADEHWRAWMAFCARNELVDDSEGVWRDRELSGHAKVGVLERALTVKEDGMREKQWPALGAAAADYDIDGGEYEAWVESLRRALDEEVDEDSNDDAIGEDESEKEDRERRRSGDYQP